MTTHRAKYIDRVPKQKQAMVQKVRDNLDAAATYLSNELKKVVSYHPASGGRTVRSAPGGHPWRQTGQLYRSIGFQRPAMFERKIGSDIGAAGDAGYPIFLEFGTRNMAPRPWLRPTFHRCLPAMNRIMRVGMKKFGVLS